MTGDDLDADRWVRRFEWHFDQVPPLLSTLRTLAVPLRAVRLDIPRVSGSSDPTRLPMRVDVVDDADDLWAALVQYVVNVADLLTIPTPPAIRASWSNRGETVGLPATVTGRDASFLAFEVIVWIIDRVDLIVGLPLADTEEYLFALIRKLRARYMVPVAERPSRRRVCVLCGDRTVGIGWVDGENGADMIGRCRRCGATYDEGAGDAMAHISGSGGPGREIDGHDPTMETQRHENPAGPAGPADRRGAGAVGVVAGPDAREPDPPAPHGTARTGNAAPRLLTM